MTNERIIGNGEQQTNQQIPAFEEQASTIDSFEGMSPGWALEWNLTPFPNREDEAGGSAGRGLGTGRRICGSDDQ